jgi:dUTP pyrophosphatase
MAQAETTDEKAVLRFVRLSHHVLPPVKLSRRVAGFLLRSPRDVMVYARDELLILTDLQIQIPEGCYGQIAHPSDVDLWKHLHVFPGVINEDYRGNVSALIFNHSHHPLCVSRGDQIAQIICQNISYPAPLEPTELDATERGCGKSRVHSLGHCCQPAEKSPYRLRG